MIKLLKAIKSPSSNFICNISHSLEAFLSLSTHFTNCCFGLGESLCDLNIDMIEVNVQALLHQVAIVGQVLDSLGKLLKSNLVSSDLVVVVSQ